MRRMIPISLLLLALAAPAGAAAQGSGTDAYTESPPTAGGDDSSGTTPPTETAPTATTPATPTPSSTPATPTSSGTTTTPESPAGGDAASPGAVRELPATGSETLVLAGVAVALLGAGLALRRRMRLSTPQAELEPQAYLSALRRVSSWEDTRGGTRRRGG